MKLYYKDTIGFACLILIAMLGGLFLFDTQLKIITISENFDILDEDNLQKAIQRYVADSIFVVFGMIIFMICIIAMIMTFSRNPMLRNIKNIKNATQKISEGDFTTRIPIIGSKDEIFDLCMDINTMAKKLSEQQQELIKKEKIATVGQLATNLAHDIKNPLASMKQSLEIIQRRSKGDEISKKESERANKVIKRIEHQVNQVLNYVKTLPLKIEHTTILTILKQSLDLLIIPNNISIEISEEDFGVKWDETQISVVFTNIILNAIQAIEKNEGKISIRAAQENDSIKIEIENTGPDIPEKDLDKIFEPLFTTKMEGTGLGLAGCKNIIQSHKGTLTVTNNPVKFTIKILKYLDDFN